jgi:hypothetical protein
VRRTDRHCRRAHCRRWRARVSGIRGRGLWGARSVRHASGCQPIRSPTRGASRSPRDASRGWPGRSLIGERARAFGRVVTAHSRHYLPPRRRAARPVSVGAGQAVVDGRPAPARHRDTERRDGVTLLRRHLIIGGDARLERRHRRSVPVGLPSPGLVTEPVLRHSLARRSCNEPLARRGAGRGSLTGPRRIAAFNPSGRRHVRRGVKG